mmetsp:Transcript_46931/g.111755  ORF Transcript_46931/g.111755 Transcript_46931/m.111755 type:complete len:207 (+) Transcript_46931:567-1187(+)
MYASLASVHPAAATAARPAVIFDPSMKMAMGSVKRNAMPVITEYVFAASMFSPGSFMSIESFDSTPRVAYTTFDVMAAPKHAQVKESSDRDAMPTPAHTGAIDSQTCHGRPTPVTSSAISAVHTGSRALTTLTKETEPRPIAMTVASWPSPWNAATLVRAFQFSGEGFGILRIPDSHWGASQMKPMPSWSTANVNGSGSTLRVFLT